MSDILNFILSILAFSLMGTICLFLWLLASYKEEIWGMIYDKD